MKRFLSLLISIVLLGLLLAGCRDGEFYNETDKKDFHSNGDTYKFEAIQLQNKMDQQTIKQLNINGGAFLFLGSLSGTYEEKNVTTLYYCGWIKNSNGGIYFAQIPFDKVRIYEDLNPGDSPVFIAYDGKYYVNGRTDMESKWGLYTVFNLHLAPGTIIPKIQLDLNNIIK
jgi:hypothetical protein